MNDTRVNNLDALIMLSGDVLIDKDVEYMDSVDISEVEISPRFTRKMQRKIRRELHHREYSRPITITRRAAAAVMITCSILFASAMSIEAVRKEFWSAIVEWFDDYISVAFEKESTAPTIIETKREPSYLPEGYDEKIIHSDSPVAYIIEYGKDGECQLLYHQMPITENDVLIDNNCEVSEVKVNGFDAVLATYSEEGRPPYVLIWNDGMYSYMISCYDKEITIEILISIAEQIE